MAIQNPNIAVIGATGAVGKVFLDLVEERNFPFNSIRLCASERSEGKQITLKGKPITVELVTEKLLSEVDMVFVSASTQVSKEIYPKAASMGCIVIDDSSAFRLEPSVPLVVPEVNKIDLKNHEGIIAIPNCSTTPLVMVLNALRTIAPISRVTVDTYQSVSGTGTAAVTELKEQTANIVNNKSPEVSVYPHQIGFNLLPHIEDFLSNGYTKEEMKMSNETRKILHDDEINISATCVRVPVFTSHSESAHIEFDGPIDIETARKVLGSAQGIKVLDDPGKNIYPMPLVSTGQDEVFVGRLREDISKQNSIALWMVSDNLRKGAALNAIQIAEELIKMD